MAEPGQLSLKRARPASEVTKLNSTGESEESNLRATEYKYQVQRQNQSLSEEPGAQTCQEKTKAREAESKPREAQALPSELWGKLGFTECSKSPGKREVPCQFGK